LSFKQIQPIKKKYTGRTSFFKELLNPALKNGAVEYNALSAYFNTGSLFSICEGLDYFLSKNCKMQIVISDEIKDVQLLGAAATSEIQEEQIVRFEDRLLNHCDLLTTTLETDTVAVLAFLMKKGLLRVKVAEMTNGLFHPKKYIIKDADNNVMVGQGSSNHTEAAVERNYEDHKLFTSWKFGKEYFYDDDPNYQTDEDDFKRIWNEEDPEIKSVRELSIEFAEELLNKLGNPEIENVVKNIEEYRENKKQEHLMKHISQSPIFQEFNVPSSSLYPHQINAVKEAQKMWPIRILFADEVGLGKTFELGFLLTYMKKFNLIKNVLILCPAQLIKQWQKELSDHFGEEFLRYDRSKKSWVYLDDDSERIAQKGDLTYSNNFPSFAIMSRFMAIKDIENNIFKDSDSFPDLLIVDEAHAARQYRNTAGKLQNTIFRRVLNKYKDAFLHIAFASATPLRKELTEPYFLLELLGIDNFISEDEYLEMFEIFSLFNRKIKLTLSQIMMVRNTIKKVVDFTNKELYESDEDMHKIYLYFENLSEPPDIPWLYENINNLIKFLTLFHPIRLFTARNVQENLKKFPETYKIPERIFVNTPIKPDDIDVDMDEYFDTLEQYTSKHYYKFESVLMPDSKLPRRLMLSRIKERFSSSFWSAKKTIENRISTIEGKLELIKNDSFSEQELRSLLKIQDLEDDFEEVVENIYGEEVKKFNSNDIDWERAIRVGEDELLSLRQIKSFSDKIISECEEGKNPDPKINCLIDELKESYEKDPDESILIFSKYTDTLEEVIKEVESELYLKQKTFNGYGIYTGGEKKIFINGFTEARNVKERDDITDSLKSKKINIVFCSNAAGEGLNLQAASKLINIDVPWVAADLEQRIGRVARLGQIRDTVKIHNYWYPNHESIMYKRIIERAKLGSLAIGTFPPVVDEDQIDSIMHDDDISEDLINSINELKESNDFKQLSSWWDLQGSEVPLGDLFRKELLELLEMFGENTQNLEHQAGQENVINFNSGVFEEYFINNSENLTIGDTEIYGLFNNDLLWGLSFKKDGELHLINPRKLPSLLKSLYCNYEIELEGEQINISNLNIRELIKIYRIIGNELLVPEHYLINPLFNKEEDDEYQIPIYYNNQLEAKMLGHVVLKR
tara:strand:+ start:2568 stop:5978 length:3411 start_codon:yes stop_codon:yes gene_type:complete